MKAYVIDEIFEGDMKKIETFLIENLVPSAMDGIFWSRIPDHLLTDTQKRHTDCMPFAAAVELGAGSIKFELYVRSLKRMQCACPGYCTPAQREYILGFADRMIESLTIRT